ncbi:hypothetical protein [Lysobacter gummosus]|uniref:hypothetical protein n=1 Tax=Lysobacter gummosus TaxID=262324 RepID=UPI00362C877B
MKKAQWTRRAAGACKRGDRKQSRMPGNDGFPPRAAPASGSSARTKRSVQSCSPAPSRRVVASRKNV